MRLKEVGRGVCYVALLCVVSGCVLICPMKIRQIEFPSLCDDSPAAQGTVLVVTGMNTHAQVLNQLSNEVCRRGWRIRPVVLSGNSSTEQIPVSREIWLQELDRAYRTVEQDFPGQPIILLGYSLGAVLSLDYRFQLNASVTDLFLLAPPVSLRPLNRIILWMGAISPFDLHVPSAAEPAYRARSYTPLSHYTALRNIIRSVARFSKQSSLREAHLTVVAARQDEFVPLSGVESWIERVAPEAELVILEKTADLGLGMAHQIIDQYSLSKEEWERVLAAMDRHFGASGGRRTACD